MPDELYSDTLQGSQLDAAVRERGHSGLSCHMASVSSVTEVQAVRDGGRFGADDGVTAKFGEALAGSRCQVELGVPTVRVGRAQLAEPLSSSDDTRVSGLEQRSRPAH